jgi:catechol 2,3-dioxygenase
MMTDHDLSIRARPGRRAWRRIKTRTTKEQRMQDYTAPAGTRVGHVHLKVANLDRAVAFYRDYLGFELVTMYGDQAAFMSAGGYHHHIGLNTWESKDGQPPAPGTTGLYHVAYNYPERKDLAAAIVRLAELQWPIDGASDHGTHEAVYLRDPDGNGIELAWDRVPEEWPRDANGTIAMVTKPLNFQSLLAELEITPVQG